MILRKRKLLMLLLATLLVITACSTPTDETLGQEEELSQEQGDAVAVVNGKPLYEGPYQRATQRMAAMYEQQGMSLEGEDGEVMMEEIRQQVLEQMIQQEVLGQEAKKNDIAVSEETVEAEIEMVKSQFASEEEYQEALAANLFTETEFTELITMELSVEAFLDENVPEIEVTEEELESYYALYKAQHEEQMAVVEEQGEALSKEELAMMELPSYEDIKEDLRAQLTQEQIQQHQQAFVSGLMESSEVEILI